jgi:hypothetical protein
MPQRIHIDQSAEADSVIDQVQDEIAKRGLTVNTRKANEWMISKVRNLVINRHKLMNDDERIQAQNFIGGMFFYFYDPKWKLVLPYYDRFPLVIPIAIYDDGWLGLNLHYLAPRLRLVLLDKLARYVNNKQLDETTRFRLTYDIIKGVSSLKEAKPCIKRYLGNHIRSDFLRIDAHEWWIAAMLPTEFFEKKTKEQVWTESVRIANKKKRKRNDNRRSA